MSWLRDLWSFLCAVFKHWKALLGGGLVIVLVAVWEHWSKRSLDWHYYAALVVLLLFFACFLAWRDERRGRLTLTAAGDIFSPEQRARIGKLINDGQVLRATMPTIPEFWNANANAWQLEADGFIESTGQTFALHDFRTLIGIASEDEVVINRYWLGHGLDVLMRLRDYGKAWPVKAAWLPKDVANEADGGDSDNPSDWVVQKLKEMRGPLSTVSLNYVLDRDREFCHGVLIHFKRAGWRIVKDKNPSPHLPTWNTQEGVLVYGRRADQIVDALRWAVGGDVMVGDPEAIRTSGQRVRIYVITPPPPSP